MASSLQLLNQRENIITAEIFHKLVDPSVQMMADILCSNNSGPLSELNSHLNLNNLNNMNNDLKNEQIQINQINQNKKNDSRINTTSNSS